MIDETNTYWCDSFKKTMVFTKMIHREITEEPMLPLLRQLLLLSNNFSTHHGGSKAIFMSINTIILPCVLK